jgi:hypothetical protein
MIASITRLSDERDFAVPQAIARLRAQPGFTQAMRTSAVGIVAMYQGGHLLNWLMDDRGRLLFGYFALYLHVTRDPDDPSSGLTPTRIKAMCVEFRICSPGRAGTMLSLMRFAGYVAPDIQVADRRQRRLVVTDKLVALLRERWRLHFAAMAPLFPDGEALRQALETPSFVVHLIPAMVARFSTGFRPVQYAPGLGLFGERNAGMMVMISLLTAGGEDDTMPPSRPVRISIAGLARRFAVSRPHVLNIIREAEAQDMLAREGDRVIIKPALAEGAQNFFASMYLFFADCAREAMRAQAGESRAAG